MSASIFFSSLKTILKRARKNDMISDLNSSIAIILMGKRELVALLDLSSWCLVVVERLFLAVLWGCLRFVIVVFPDHTHLLFFVYIPKLTVDVSLLKHAADISFRCIFWSTIIVGSMTKHRTTKHRKAKYKKRHNIER